MPMYTIGLRILFDCLRRLVLEGSQDAELEGAIASLRTVAAYTNWDSGTTSLMMAEGLEQHPRTREGVGQDLSALGRRRGLTYFSYRSRIR